MIAVVTGASRGIGFAIAKELKNMGYKVIGVFRDENEKENVEKEGMIPFVGDVAYPDTWKKLKEYIEKEFGYVNIIVNNAGIHEKKKVWDLSIEEFDYVMKVNLYSIFYSVKFLLDLMKKAPDPRVIINISSVVAYTGSGTGGVAYVASKAGILGITRELAKELADYGIRVNAVAPGYVETAMLSHWDEKRREEAIKKLLIKRLGKPEDIAKAVRFLIEHDYITGSVIHVNGGLFFNP